MQSSRNIDGCFNNKLGAGTTQAKFVVLVIIGRMVNVHNNIILVIIGRVVNVHNNIFQTHFR